MKSAQLAQTLAFMAFLLPSLFQPAAAQDVLSPVGHPGRRTAPLLLLSRPEVRAELQLTEKQTESALKTISDLHARAMALRGKPDQPDVIAARKAIDDEQYRWIAAELSQRQQTRLQQIELQWEGPIALVSRPDVADLVGLTSDQQQKLRAALNRVPQSRGGLASAPDAATVEEGFGQAINLLDDQQRTRWASLLGRPVPFSAQP